jgi:hypothetical protein
MAYKYKTHMPRPDYTDWALCGATTGTWICLGLQTPSDDLTLGKRLEDVTCKTCIRMVTKPKGWTISLFKRNGIDIVGASA